MVMATAIMVGMAGQPPPSSRYGGNSGYGGSGGYGGYGNQGSGDTAAAMVVATEEAMAAATEIVITVSAII